MVSLDPPKPRGGASAAVMLERRRGPGAAWTPVCEAPCEVATPVVDSYRVVGPGLRPSQAFMLANGPSRIVLQVDPAQHAKYLTGAWLLGGGAMLVAVGATVIIVGANPSISFDGRNIVQNTSIGWLLAGSSLVVGGVIGAILGASLAFDNAQTTVKGDAVDQASGETAGATRAAPTAHAATATSRPGISTEAPGALGPARGLMLPLLDLHF